MNKVRRNVVIGDVTYNILLHAQPEEEQHVHPQQCDLWAFAWGSGGVAASIVDAYIRTNVRSMAMLEIGAGLALPSLVSAKFGVDTLATDLITDALEVLSHNGSIYNVNNLNTSKLNWDSPASTLGDSKFDIIVCADVLYLRRSISPIINLIRDYLNMNSQYICVLVEDLHARNSSRSSLRRRCHSDIDNLSVLDVA